MVSIVANLSITAVEGHYQAYRRIIIEDDHQTVSHGTRLLEVLHVPYVQEIKTAIRENDTLASLALSL